MIESVPHEDREPPFTPPPRLLPLGKLFPSKRFPGLFYYDTGEAGREGFSAWNRPGKAPARPALILIHGLGDEADTWRHVILLLAAEYRVLAPDLPGFGRSRVPGLRFSIPRHAEAVLELASAAAERQTPEKAGVILVGSSMGAAVAEEAALRAERKSPGLVKGIILLDGCIPQGGPFPLSLALASLSKKWYRAFRQNSEGLKHSLAPYYANFGELSRTDRDFLYRRLRDRVESLSQERAYFSSLRSMILRSVFCFFRYRRIVRWKGDIGLLWGEADQVVPPARAAFFQSLFAGRGKTPPLVMIPGAGHLPQQEKPEATVRGIFALLDSWDKTAKP